MARVAGEKRIEKLTVGDFDVRHPICRAPILITEVQHSQRRTVFTGICPRCDRYVRLVLSHDDDPFGD